MVRMPGVCGPGRAAPSDAGSTRRETLHDKTLGDQPAHRLDSAVSGMVGRVPHDAPVDEGRTALHEEVEAPRAILANIGLDDAADAEESTRSPTGPRDHRGLDPVRSAVVRTYPRVIVNGWP
jgi:hypothetical protein